MSDQNANPHALGEAQDDEEIFEVMEGPPSSFDLFKDQPRSTGVRKRRAAVHKDQDWHCSAHVWLVDPVRRLVLVQKRSEHKDTFPGMWDISAAGHIEAAGTSSSSSSSPKDTAVRELAEELGIDNVERDAFVFGFICPAEQADWGGCNAYEHVYFVHVDKDTCRIRAGQAEVTAVQWIEIDILEQKLRQRDSQYVPRVESYIDAFFEYLNKI